MQLPSFKNPVFKSLTLICGITVLILLVLHLTVSLSLFWLLIPLGVWLTITSYGVFSIQSGVFISAQNTIQPIDNQVAITFDDGPHPNTAKILDILKQYNAKATFFIVGENAEKYPELVKRIANEGHTIGNHTYSHKHTFPIFGLNEIIEDISKTSIIIKKLTGKQPQFFRPPFGVTNPRIAKAVNKLNLKTIGWNIRSLDTKIKNPERVVSRVNKRIKPGSVILLHDYTDSYSKILEQILSYMSSNNYTFKTF